MPNPIERRPPPIEVDIVSDQHRISQARSHRHAQINMYISHPSNEPHICRNDRRQRRAINDANHQYQAQNDQPRSHRKAPPSHLDAPPSSPTVHGGENDYVDGLEDDGDSGACNGGLEPLRLLLSRDRDAGDFFQKGVAHGIDVAVAVEVGDGIGLEVWTAPGD